MGESLVGEIAGSCEGEHNSPQPLRNLCDDVCRGAVAVGPRFLSRVMVNRILNKYGYPPDLQEVALKTVLWQAEMPCTDWAE